MQVTPEGVLPTLVRVALKLPAEEATLLVPVAIANASEVVGAPGNEKRSGSRTTVRAETVSLTVVSLGG